MQTTLFVTYHYPPSQAVGGVRPSKLVRYLQDFGWLSIVLTAARGTEPDMAAETKIVRVPEWPHPLKVYQGFRERQLRRLGRLDELRAKTMPSYEDAMQRPHPRRLSSWIIPLLSVPDRELGWVVPAIWKGWRQIKHHNAKCVVTTGPPFSAHLVGLVLKRWTGLPWVAEFRDPWAPTYKYQVLRNAVSDVVEGRLIKHVMRRADRIVSVTSRMTDEVMKDHPELSPTKFLTLTSGFDPADYQGLNWKRPPATPVVFAYFGTFYHGRTPEPFLRALRSLLDDGMLKGQDVRVKFVGQVERAEGRALDAMVRELNLESILTIEGPVPRQEALRQTLEAHVVLVLNEQHPIQIPFKFYEALGAGALILNVGSAGAVSDTLSHTGRGVAVDYRSTAEVRRGILTCVERTKQQATLHRDPPWQEPSLGSLSFPYIAGRLAGVLDSLQGA